MNVCVFCSSSSQLPEEFVEVARSVGQWIGDGGHRLVWGGCNVGLMNEVGLAVQRSGGTTCAVVPEFMAQQQLVFEGADEVEVVSDMQERKSRMRQAAAAFVVLPGGVGTWEEFLEVVALKKLRRLDAPIVLVNCNDYYAPLLQQFHHSIDQGCSPPTILEMFDVATTVTEVAALLAGARPVPADLDLGPTG
jgi:uncharacterized protein (TIGR00730 family)